jgi:hypothetical protein
MGELVGVDEIAGMFEVTFDQAMRFSGEPGFPAPEDVSDGPLWRRTAVEEWFESSGRGEARRTLRTWLNRDSQR